ncbi:response regulator [Mariniphaga sediminis]|uniref:response regulator n=1 Tax=Mariniphaga sediminis TaxID=1628158 RepID=UPI00356379D5
MNEKVSIPKEEKKTILIVEDDETSFLLLEALLASGNYELLYATNGKQAIQLLKKNPETDLILMDLKMPVMDGYEASQKIREFNKNIPIIAQTAYALSGDNQKAIEAGCDDYITKPIKKDDLLAKIKVLLK